jgi:putative transposase
MLQKIIKLKLNKNQEKTLNDWLFYSKNIYNWAISQMNYKVEHGFYFHEYDITNSLSGHCQRLGMPSAILMGVLLDAYDAWARCLKKLSKRPRFKSYKNPMTSMLCRCSIREYNVLLNKIKLPIIGWLNFFENDLPEGKVKQARFIKKPSGWHIGLFIDAEPKAVQPISSGAIGIDPGYKTHLTLSNGEKIDLMDAEYNRITARIAQAQKGGNKKLVARLHEKRANLRKLQNHTLSKSLVQRFDHIAYPKDDIQKIAKEFGKSAAKASHHQLKEMIKYKAKSTNRTFIEISSAFTSMTCSSCGEKTKLDLSQREWTCECGTHHDRDINAAKNILNFSYDNFKHVQKKDIVRVRKSRKNKASL